MIKSYARVSTTAQELDGQIETLKAAGAERVYKEKISGARNDRRELRRMMDGLEPGDVVLVTRIDRLARSTFELFALVKEIVDKGAQFRSIAQPWADTSTANGRLMIAVLGGLADVERDMIRARTDEGRVRARAAGVKFGRKSSLTPHQKREAIARRAAGEGVRDIARSFNVSHTTIVRLARTNGTGAPETA
jgi:DNA invertase Pin-like site-specific DNA recombinase